MIGGLGVYLWARESFGNAGALVAGLAYTLAPYHVNQLFNAFTYAEFAAAGILPFCFFFASRVCSKGRWSDICLLASSYGLLLLTHLPMAVMGSLSLFVFGIFSLRSKGWHSSVFRLSVAALLGLALSSFYWVRMISELSLVRHSTAEFVSADFDYRNNFLFSFIWAPNADSLDRSLWFADLMLFATMALTLPAAIVYWADRNRSRGPLTGSIAVAVLALFMATPLSLPVWNAFDLLQKIQFPWRWLAPFTLAVSLFIAAGFEGVTKWFGTQRMRPLALVAFGLAAISIAFTASQIIRPAVYLPRSEFANRISGLVGGQSCECWWPVWARRDALLDRTPVQVPGRAAVEISNTGTQAKFRIEDGPDAAARLALFYYPNWQASINGKAVTIEPGKDGTLTVNVPPGEAELNISFVEWPAARLAQVVSILTFLSLFGSVVFGFVYRSKVRQ